MRVYLDDLRPTPEGFDVRVYTAQGAIDVLSSKHVTLISLDNDLGDLSDGNMTEGRHVANWIEQAAYEGTIPRCEILIHSANPVARKAIGAAIAKANEYWDNHEQLA